MPDILSGKEKQFYTQILAAIRGQRWAEAKALLADAKGGPLDDFLRAEYWLAANSPRAELSDLMPILARSPWLPQAAQLGRLATRRDRKSVVEGKSVSVRVDLGGRRIMKKKK